jgi:hypothetical protein
MPYHTISPGMPGGHLIQNRAVINRTIPSVALRPMDLYAVAGSRTDFGRHFDERRMFGLKSLLLSAQVGAGDHVVEIGCGRSADIPVIASLLGARVTAAEPNSRHLDSAKETTAQFLLAEKGDETERSVFRSCFDRITWLAGDEGDLLRMATPEPARAVIMEGLIDPFISVPEAGIIPKYSGSDIELFLNRAYGFLSAPGSLMVGVFQLPEDIGYFADIIKRFASSKPDIYMHPSYRILPRSLSTIWEGPDVCQMFVLEKK